MLEIGAEAKKSNGGNWNLTPLLYALSKIWFFKTLKAKDKKYQQRKLGSRFRGLNKPWRVAL